MDELPGADPSSPILIGSSTSFKVMVKNISEHNKLYNIWLALDIYHFNPDSGKVENTKTSFPDMENDGTKKIGKIDFINQGISAINPGESVTFLSRPYYFNTSVSGYRYSSSRYPYFFSSKVWSNGQPNQSSPAVAVSLNKQLSKRPFFLADNIDPLAPENLRVIFETDSIAQIMWDIDSLDVNDINKYIIFSGNDSITMYPVDTIDASINNGIIQISKSESYRFIRVSAVDIGGLTSNLSNSIKLGIVTKVIEFAQHLEIPKEFSLKQNYPNPFNPYTVIMYDIPKESHVTLEIYEVSGKRIKTLLSENKTAGTYSIVWDGLDSENVPVASGVYYYRIIVPSSNSNSPYVETKKMILIR